MTKPFRFLSSNEEFVADTIDSDLRMTGTIVGHQTIAQSFLDNIANLRNAQDASSFSALTKGDDLEKIRIASIPVSVVNKWRREGFDMLALIDSGDPQAASLILAKLRADDLTAFQATTRNI